MCLLWPVIRFLQAEGYSAAEIHRRICIVYGENFISNGFVQERCRMFRKGRTDVDNKGGSRKVMLKQLNVNNTKRTGRPSVKMLADRLLKN